MSASTSQDRRRPRAPHGETRERVLEFVRACVRAGMPPTVREVQSALGFRAVQSAREQLEKLVAEGRLLKQAGLARGYRLPDAEAAHTAWIPLLGRVQAGALSTAIEDRQGEVLIDVQRLRGYDQGRALQQQLFALRVRGESMRDAGILDGDVVIVRRTPHADSGDIVVALVGDEATVKRLRVRDGQVELHPENPAFAPIAIRAGDELTLLGRVIEVRRHVAEGTREP